MADVTYNYIKAFNGVPKSEDPKAWYSTLISNDNANPDTTLTLQAGDYFIVNYSGGQNYKYIFTAGPLGIPATDGEINVLLESTDAECFFNLRDAILNTEFLITTIGGAYPLPGVLGTKYAYAGAAVFNDPTTTHHAAVGSRIVNFKLDITVSPYFWNQLDTAAETVNIRGFVGGGFNGSIGSTTLNSGTGEVGEDLSLDPTSTGTRNNAFHFNTIQWELSAPAGANGFFEVVRVVSDGVFDVSVGVARFPVNFEPGVDGVTPGTNELANESRIPFTYESSTETYTFYDTFVIDEKPSCTVPSVEYPIFSNYGLSVGLTEYPPTSTPVMGIEFYNGINNSEIQQYARPNAPYPTPLEPSNGGVRYEVRFIDAVGTIFPTQDAIPQGEVDPAQNGNFEKFGLIRAQRPSLGLVEKTCDAGGDGCDLYRTRVFLPGGLFNDTTFGGVYSATNEQFLLELIGSQIYNNDISSICDYPSDWVLDAPNIAFIREVNGVEEYITPFDLGNPAGNQAGACRFFSTGSSCSFDDVFYTSRDGTECENEDGIPTLPVVCNTVDSINYYIEATYTAIPAGAPGVPACPADGVSVTGRVRVESFGEIAVQTIFYDDSCFGPNPGLKNYIPCCPRIALTSTTVADCFSDNQGNVTFEWDLFYGADETPTSITIFRSSGVFGNETTVLTPSYGEFENGWIDTGLILPTTCVSDVDVEYTITFEWAEDATGAPVTDFVATVVTIPCCYQDCGDITNGCDLCWAKEDSNLKVYLESYFEDPLKTPKEASFQIKYCIDDACALGISDAEVYITLPAGVTVTRFESLASTYGTISFEESFANGVYPGRWKFTVLRTPGSAIEELLQPTYGVLGDVYFDKPLGDNVACIHEDTSVTVVVADTPITSPPTEDPTPIVYEEENNLSLTESPADPTKSWQTGPCLSTCTDELDIGFGDFHFSMDAVDNSIFDVKYCLTQGSIDSFVLVCLTGDFKTKVTSIDTEFGDAIARGWKVGFRNLSPGFTLIYGRGARPIPTSGISTLIRVYLDNDIIQRNPSGEESCLCIFPLFTNLGSLFSKVESYIANFGTQPSVALKDSEIVGGTTEASYSPTPITTSGAIGTSATRDTGSSLTPLPPATISTSINSDFTPATFAGYQVGSGFLADLEVIAANIDERFLPLVNCLTVSFGRVITDWQNTEEYARDRGTLDNAIKTAHYFRIFFTIWTALLRSIPNLAAKFKNSAQTIDDSCTNGVGIIFECDDSSPKNISCHITYDLSLCASSGIEFDLSDFQTFVDDAGNGVSLEDSLSWTGDASDKNYIQVYSPTSGKYITVYGADLAQRTDTDTKIDYLRTDSSSPSYQHLTTIKLSISDYTDWGGDQATFENTICPIVFAAKDNDGTWAGLATLSDYDKFVELRNAIKVGLNKVRIVSNEKGTTPTAQWTGNSFAPSGLQSIDVKDFLTTLVNVVEPATFDLSEENLESIIKLPTSAGTKTLKQFYNLNDINLSGVTYAPNGTDAYKDPSGNFILPTIDANGDGKIDIVDLVALRNTWLYSNQYPLSNTATISARQIVPNDCCAKLDLDVEILVADDCSQFCIQPPCFGKVWLSDMLLIKDQFGRPDKYILEVSYGVNCSDETVSEVDYPVQDISGVQFRIQGLTNAGIVSSINGFGVEEGKTATAIKAKEWSEHILSSDTITKDTYISFSTNGKYINKGKGILCYLVVDPSSIPDAESYLADRFEEEYITTNKFIKFENSPDVVGISEVAGSKIGYPLANLRLGSHHTDELLIFERFGIRTTEYKLSSNRYYNVDDPSGPYVNMTSAPAVSWTGDRTGDGIGDSDLTYVLQLAATKTYEEQFDANASGKIDILDVQAVSNTINDQVFNYGADVVPRYCCDIGELITPVISVTDYTAGEVIIPVVQNGKIREVTLNGSSLGCGASAENQGGVLLYWDTLRYADYYVVYRKGQNDTSAIPIIAAGPGNRNRIGSFPTEDRSAERDPISILPNMWIDYPPIKEDDCCSLANFDVGAYFSGDVATAVTTEIETRLGTTITPGATSEAFTYWIVAISREGEVRSVERDGSVSCCSFDPISSDVFIATTTNTQFSAKFDAYHPLASRPIGAADQTSGEALPVWFFPQNSINGKGREGISDKGGTVVTDSKLPDRLDASGANQRGFVYTPKPNFVGKDTFKYITTIVDIKNRFRPSTWCKSISTVTAYVSPPAPLLLARAGSNSIPSEKDKAFLSWSNSKGATSYKLYRDTVLIDTIPAENEKTNRYRYTDTTPNLPVCPAPATPVKNTYEISSVYLDPDGTEIESSKNSTTVTFVCPPDLDTTSTVINLTQVGFNIPIGGTKLSTGTVVVSWGAVANADYYSVFRKETTSSDWIFRGKTNTPTFRDNIPSCNECSPATQSYDYYITAFSRGYQSDPSPDVTTVIPCYDAFPPQVSDKSGTVEERQTLSSSVSARAVQGTISVYSVVTPPASDSGTLTFLPDGTFTFAAALNFIGNTQFEWQAQDSCGNTSSALFTINVTATPVDDESNYTISSITKLTSQQNTRGIRQRNATISQVPFVLNNKGAPSLRKRCSAFSITRGVDPSTWAPSSDGCGIPLDANLDPGDTCVDPTIGTAIIGTSEIGECE